MLFRSEVLEKVRKVLLVMEYDYAVAEAFLQQELELLTKALQRFIGIIIGLLSRSGAPSIMDYGCCYRLSNLLDSGTAFFSIRDPSGVYTELEDTDPNTMKGF